MARIYYHEERLSGHAFENEVINVKLFDLIFENTETNGYDIKPISTSSFFGLIKSKNNTFKTVGVSRDGINYNTTEGNFYLPKALIFYDNNDNTFPSEFYFIAKIQDQIEIRKCSGGKTVKWFQIPDLHSEVKDAKIIQKIENTLLELKKLLPTTQKAVININKKKDKVKVEENQPLLNKSVKEAYQALAKICLGMNSKEKNVIEFFDTLKNYDKDLEYFTTLNFVIDFLEQNDNSFILRLDWKADIEDLEWVLKSALNDNFNVSFDLPNPGDYGKNASVSFDNVFEDFNKSLKQNGFQMSFIDTQSDEYVFLLHKLEDKKEVENSINEIGYKYYEK
ncbi:hypothetical protein QSV08_12515 [Maribacter sp. BPC-D8]|uniref:DUF6630 family protein n=1 Tax=Maribacter sp. BPC-D8 TaxID=3053613 RepID=UPI002B46C5D8|nr:hypothetical protein [Maribacter sp. BPC-D8]WRI28048.1 hypothetical protein QSV08_12515 [Maribacter sp. BPC-D8]